MRRSNRDDHCGIHLRFVLVVHVGDVPFQLCWLSNHHDRDHGLSDLQGASRLQQQQQVSHKDKGAGFLISVGSFTMISITIPLARACDCHKWFLYLESWRLTIGQGLDLLAKLGFFSSSQML